jgi:hypothetical protein
MCAAQTLSAKSPSRRQPKRPWEVWRDRRGHFSYLRTGTLLLLAMPAMKALWDAYAIAHGARPLNE